MVASFDKLYSQHREKIYNYLRSRLSTKEDAEDLTAEVFEKVYKNLADFKWQGISIKSWIYRIARNSLIDHHRRSKKYKGQVDIDKVENKTVDVENIDPLVLSLNDEYQHKLYQAISDFPADDQYLIYYKYFEELSAEEIGRRMKLSDTNVTTRLHRLRKKIYKLINEETDQETKK